MVVSLYSIVLLINPKILEALLYACSPMLHQMCSPYLLLVWNSVGFKTSLTYITIHRNLCYQNFGRNENNDNHLCEVQNQKYCQMPKIQ